MKFIGQTMKEITTVNEDGDSFIQCGLQKKPAVVNLSRLSTAGSLKPTVDAHAARAGNLN